MCPRRSFGFFTLLVLMLFIAAARADCSEPLVRAYYERTTWPVDPWGTLRWFIQPTKHSLTTDDLQTIASLIKKYDIPGLSLRGVTLPASDSLDVLEDLSLSDLDLSGVTVHNFEFLRHLSGLERLTLSGRDLTSSTLELLPTLPKLQSLVLENSGLTNADLLRLPFLSSLAQLGLPQFDLDEQGARALAAAPHLASLDLRNSRVTHQALFLISTIPLKYLNMSGVTLSDDDLRRIGSMTSLQDLDLSDTTFSDKGVAYLADLQQLKSLRVGRTQVTDAGLIDLSRLSQLHYVDLDGTNISSAIFTSPMVAPQSNLDYPRDSNTPLATQAGYHINPIAFCLTNTKIQKSTLREMHSGFSLTCQDRFFPKNDFPPNKE